MAAFLAKKFKKELVLWGSSMGAVSVLLSEWPSAIVLDSPFADFKRLGSELLMREKPRWVCGCLAGCLLELAFCVVNCGTKKKAAVDLAELDIKGKLSKRDCSKTMAVFMAGYHDELIDMQHSFDLYRAYSGKKEFMPFEGSHNSRRPAGLLARVFRSLFEHLTERGLAPPRDGH